MKRFISIISLLLLCVISFAETTESLEVKTFTLSNGMEVWINEDHSLPKAYGAVVVKAGAKDCPGTGIAHYFEHMMFKGTEKIGTVDYAAEKPYLDSIAALYDKLSVAPSDSVRKDIQMEINRLNIAAGDYAIPNEFNDLISACGGSELNAYTSQDITVYHNQFMPSFFAQWAELNSERLISPVFRLFQSELETVYEEKNRAESNEFNAFAQMITAEGFKGSPYEYQVIGTTENLKAPQLSRMKEFYDKYYVAGNMGIMLTGDIDASEAIPVLEKTFGKIRRGSVEGNAALSLSAYEGRTDLTALAKVPIIKMRALCFRAPSKKDDDYLALSFLAFMLNNSEGIGLLDKLTTEHKISAAICLYPDLAFNDAGIFPILIMPKLLFQSNKKAERIVNDVLEKVKDGDFSEDFFNGCKQTFKRNLVLQTESIGGRMNQMVNTYASGKNWNDVVSYADKVDSFSKEDAVALANKYFGDDRLVITKKFGSAQKEDLRKPPYKKVTPKHTGESSAYAMAIKNNAGKVALPRVLVDCVNGAERIAVTDKVSLYTVNNNLNDIFNLRISYPVGTNECPSAELVAQYLNLIGTESMSYDEHRAKLQALGSTISISAGREAFNIRVSGFDNNFRQTIALVSDLLDKPKGDKKKIKIIKENELSGRIMVKRDIEEMDNAIFQKVVYGDNSSYLTDKGSIEDASLIDAFRDIQSNEFDIHYSGTLSGQDVSAALNDCEFIGRAVKNHPFYCKKKPVIENADCVYLINKKKAPQSRINAIVLGNTAEDFTSRYLSSAFEDYMGGGMSSVLFQEIREFRSMAYSTSASVVKPNYSNREETPTFFYAFVGTQSDKTTEAMSVLDSLIRNLPLSEKRVRQTAKNLWFDRINSFPGFRNISYWIASGVYRQGVDSDKANDLYDLLETLSEDDIKQYWQDNVSGRNIVWTVVGNADKINKEELSKFGDVKELEIKDIIK